MNLVIIALAALFASLLTFFSGFGLGTLLMPVFAVFFPVDIAIALTAVVHLANNVFKWVLVRKYIHWGIALRFGLPAIVTAFLGAGLLVYVNRMGAIWQWQIGESVFLITPVKIMIGLLLMFFALMEALPSLRNWKVAPDKMVYGGLLSGFFGGLSGHQGALRSAFLIRAGLSKEAYIATGVIIACFIDLARLSVYSGRFTRLDWTSYSNPVLVGIISAFLGAYIGSRLLKKITLTQVQVLVSLLLALLALALGLGII